MDMVRRHPMCHDSEHGFSIPMCDSGYDTGYADGFKEGDTSATARVETQAFAKGYSKGFAEGVDNGYHTGFDKGYAKGFGKGKGRTWLDYRSRDEPSPPMAAHPDDEARTEWMTGMQIIESLRCYPPETSDVEEQGR
jgi:hypothetical protein